jgi:SRSO17 transposase
MALGVVARAIAAGLPFGWVAADSVYGVGDIDGAATYGQGLCAGRECHHHFGS